MSLHFIMVMVHYAAFAVRRKKSCLNANLKRCQAMSSLLSTNLWIA